MNIELRLLATMLYRGNFDPLIRGDITAEHFTSDEGKILYNFITGYRHGTGGEIKFPSLSIVRSRFKNAAIEIPVPDPGDNVEALAHETALQRLKDKLRAAAEELESIANTSSDPVGDSMPIIGRLRSATEVSRKGQHISLASGILSVTEDYCKGTILPSGIPWPWESMTQATKGMQRKEFIVVAGRPKSRKTFTALWMLMHAVKNDGARVLVFSPEMPVRQMLLRCIAMLTGLRYTEFKDGTLSEAEEMRLFEAARDFGAVDGEDDEGYTLRLTEQLGIAPTLDIVQSTGRDLAWMESQIAMYRPDIALFDSFYRQHADGVRKGDSEWRAVTALSRGLKDMIMQTNIVGVGTHQLNRGAQKELGDISNLSLADAVGQDADMVLRVVTGKMDNIDRSALVVLGGREVPFDGILFNNVPCSDFSEIGPITNLKVVERLMAAEEDAQDEDPKEAEASKRKQTSRGNLMRKAADNAAKSIAGGAFGSEDTAGDADTEDAA